MSTPIYPEFTVNRGNQVTLSNGNLTASAPTGCSVVQSTSPMGAGQYYFEVSIDNLIGTDGIAIGVAGCSMDLTYCGLSNIVNQIWGVPVMNTFGLGSDGTFQCQSGQTQASQIMNTHISNKLWNAFSTGDMVMVAIDTQYGYIFYGENGSQLGDDPNTFNDQGAADSSSFCQFYAGLPYQVVIWLNPNAQRSGGDNSVTVNFGATPFSYQIPNGYTPITI